MTIRPEQSGDEQTIHDLTAEAFAPMAFSDGTEPQIIRDLRRDGNLTLSLVALQNSKIVGHVAFSPVTMGEESEGWFGLGPISVAPDRQRNGIGSALVEEGLRRLRENKATGCVLIGNPAFYARFGFVSDGNLTYGDVPPAYVQWLALDGRSKAKGDLKYAPAFDV